MVRRIAVKSIEIASACIIVALLFTGMDVATTVAGEPGSYQTMSNA